MLVLIYYTLLNRILTVIGYCGETKLTKTSLRDFMKKTLLFLASSFISFASFNALANDDDNDMSILLKAKIGGTYVNGEIKDLPDPTSTSPEKIEKIFNYGISGNASATVFLTSSLAGEVGVGVSYLNLNKSAFENIANNYEGTFDKTKSEGEFIIPSYLTAQYYFAPYGGIRPYIGAGYHFTFSTTKSKKYKIENSSGPVIQSGVDFVFADDTYLTLDVKYLMMEPKIKYDKSFIQKNEKPVSGKLKLNPVFIGIGLGFKL